MNLLKNKYSFVQILLLVFAFVIPFQRLFHSSWFIYKFQLPELIAIPICILSVWYSSHLAKPHPSVYPIILFTLWSILSIGFHFSNPVVLEGLGIFYLFLLGYATCKIVSNAPQAYPELLLKVFVLGVLLNCLLSLFGLFLFCQGIENDLGIWYAHYPIIGSLYRMKGFTSHPIMLSNLAICAFFLSLSLFSKYRNIILVTLCIGIGLSLTKSILSGIAAFGFVYLMFFNRHHRRFSMVLWCCFVAILVMKEYTTHFTFPLSKQEVSILSQAQYWGGDTKLPVTATHSIYNTLYAQLKQSSWEAFLENPITGVGGGNTNGYNLEKVNQGLLPSRLSHYDPHSSLFGVLAEFGIIGFILILLSFRSIFKITNLFLAEKKTGLMLSILSIFLFIAFESLSADVLNYRHLWLLGGVLYGIYFSTISPSITPCFDSLDKKEVSTHS